MGANTVLFVATEASPFIKTGGLGEVVGALPRELARQGLDVRVILPMFRDIPNPWKKKMTYLAGFVVKNGKHKQYCGIQKATHEGIKFYFIHSDYYFCRPGLYGFADDTERFAYFCKAVLEALPYLDYTPRILHCHDWRTASMPLLLKIHYSTKPRYAKLRTVLTIYNAAYRGNFNRSSVDALPDLSMEGSLAFDRLEQNGALSLLEFGSLFADRITTVGNICARELTTDEDGWGLGRLLRQRQAELCSIINSNDTYDPASDKMLFANYSWQAPRRKQENKTRLQEYLGFPVRPDTPLFGMVKRLATTNGFDMIAAALMELLAKDIQLVIMGPGEEKYASMLSMAARKNPDRLSVNTYLDEDIAHKIFAGSDLYLQPSLSEPCGTSHLVAMRYGCVPIVRGTGRLKDTVVPYNEYSGEGNGFCFREATVHDMLHAIDQAISCFRDKTTWNRIVRSAMMVDHSWRSIEYLAVYNSLAKTVPESVS